MNVKKGQLVTLTFEDREFEAIVIDPHGLGYGQPSIGFGARMMERHAGLRHSTISLWFEGGQNSEGEWLKTPSGKTFKMVRITGEDANEYSVLEISDWFAIAKDLCKNPGKLKKAAREGLVEFICWFAVKGFYADAYAALKGAYTQDDSRAVIERIVSFTKREWSIRFDSKWQEEACRLTEVSWSHPRMGQFINQTVYDFFPPEAIAVIRKLNANGQEEHTAHHQYLTEDFDETKYQEHLQQVYFHMKGATNLHTFWRAMETAFKRPFQLDVFEDVVPEKPKRHKGKRV